MAYGGTIYYRLMKSVRRLFSQFRPQHYDVQIALSDDKTQFSGSVTIQGKKVGRPAQRITLHQKALKIGTATITHTDKKGVTTDIDVTRTVSHAAYDELRLHTDQKLFPGEYTITVEFSGTITDNMDGIYPCYFTEDGEQKKLIATQFESHHARDAFPCIDEPEAKATFQLHLTHAAREVALSNTLPQSASTDDTAGTTTTTFNVTPEMSTYLFAFVTGELHSKESTSKSGVAIRCWATRDQVANTAFALKEACVHMDFYEKYYDIPFPLEKCDFVALPDFASGAMENWGLLTFREQTLLVDEDTSLGTKQYVAIVVAHELTHQWFGNLVTMKWWTDLWLNEGFASWMEYVAVHALHPEWKLWTQFAVDDQQPALRMDALEHTHPVEVPVKHPDEIRSIFDIISYQKGASVIHMLNDYLGADMFRDGLRHYLKKHAYKNTVTADLWQALEDVSGRPVTSFMHAWTSFSGYPIVSAHVKDDHLSITQQRFVSNPSSDARKDDALWPVPLLADNLSEQIATKRTTNIPLIDPKKQVVKINMNQTGFYRVDYSPEMQTLQKQAIASGELSDIDRMGLLADGFAVTKAGFQPTTEYLDLLSSYSSESTLPVWEIIVSSLGSIRAVLSKDNQDMALRHAMQPYIQQLVKPQLTRIGITAKDSDTHLDTLLRPIIVSMAAGAEHQDTVSKLQQLYKNRDTTGGKIDPDLRGVVYSTVARTGGTLEFEQLLALHAATTTADERLALCGALTSFEQPELHERVLQLIQSDAVKIQDAMYWIAYSLMNRHSRMRTWKWMRDNWSWLKDTMGTELSFARFPIYTARTFSDETRLQEYQEFFGTVMEPMLQRSYNQGVEIIETASAWRKRDAQTTLEWFKNHS